MISNFTGFSAYNFELISAKGWRVVVEYNVTLLIFGILLLLLGLVGKVKAKEIEVGTSSVSVRVVTALIGFTLMIFSFNTDIPKDFLDKFTNQATKSGKEPPEEPKVEPSERASGLDLLPPALAEEPSEKTLAQASGIASAWLDAYENGDAAALTRLSGDPLFFGNDIVKLRYELRSRYDELLAQVGNEERRNFAAEVTVETRTADQWRVEGRIYDPTAESFQAFDMIALFIRRSDGTPRGGLVIKPYGNEFRVAVVLGN